ncbi:imm11 family protein [Photobacterium salinisoli]|uniref:imm11 family protein n=1 Tax=Photobacterium salinisoli TaxID=1616783 RepID=UPI000EA082DB|nr:DUF1629 domain-containing protein [Photobacterium salinisoli]
MNYYILEREFIEGEASFHFDEDYIDILDYSQIGVRFYNSPPKIFVDEEYKERAMSDILKALDLLPRKNIANMLASNYIKGVQFIPVLVDNDGVVYDDYYHMNVFSSYPLLNEYASEARRYSNYYESYKTVTRMVIDSKKLAKSNIVHDVFRVKEHCWKIIVNEKVKLILSQLNVSGVRLTPVEII